MTSETRTIDLDALATELEAAGFKFKRGHNWISVKYPRMDLFIWADGELHTGCCRFTSPSDFQLLGIVQRHIAGSQL